MHPPVCEDYKSLEGCKFGEKCSLLHGETDKAEEGKEVQRTRVGDPCSDRQLTGPKIDLRQKLCSSQRNGIANPPLGAIQPTQPHERSFFAPKSEKRSQEDTFCTRVVGLQRSLGLGQESCTTSKETWIRTERQSSHFRKCGVFLRHHKLNWRKRLCRGFQGLRAHAEQDGCKCSSTGNRERHPDTLRKSKIWIYL